VLRARWLGRVPYDEALSIQRGLFAHASDDYLLLLEHPHTYTLGVRAADDHVLVDPTTVGAELHRVDRGGDVTYHGPGQLVGYPILHVAGRGGRRAGGMVDTVAYVRSVEQLVIDALSDLGMPQVGRLDRFPGVWVDPTGVRPRKIAAIGVRLTRGRSMHGFALNVAPDLAMFDHIVPCGISDKGVTSLAAEGIDVSMRDVVDVVSARAASPWRPRCSRSPSVSCASMVRAGLSAVCGSCGMSVMSRPRIARSSPDGIVSRSRPSKRSQPPVMPLSRLGLRSLTVSPVKMV